MGDWILQQNDASSSSGAEQQKKDKRQNLDLRAVVHPFNELTERRENFYALISKGINSKDDADVAEGVSADYTAAARTIQLKASTLMECMQVLDMAEQEAGRLQHESNEACTRADSLIANTELQVVRIVISKAKALKKVLDQRLLNDHGLARLKQSNAKTLVDDLDEEIAAAEAVLDSTEATRGNSKGEDQQAKDLAAQQISRLRKITSPRLRRQLSEAR